MINFFKKKNKIRDEDYEFLLKVVEALPQQYSYLKNQTNKDFILDKRVNDLGTEGTYTLILNASLEKKYSNKSLPEFFIIKDISIWNIVKRNFEIFELHILNGMLAGFKVASNYSDLDLSKINTSRIKEKHFKSEDKDLLKDLIGELQFEVLSILDIESTFKIEIPEGDFYVIKDLGDGNYLSMDKTGAVFGMIHDPYEIEKLFNHKEDFFKAIINDQFNIDKYYNRKMS